jgi:hypothetical protein
MKLYKRLFEETIKLDDVSLVDKIFEWFKQNPYPQDHDGLHKWAESMSIEPDVIETYIYAIVSCFVSGGNFNKKKADESKFDPEEVKMSLKVEAEHIDKDNNNPVVKRIAYLISKRIGADHDSDNPSYYADGRDGKLQLEELK